MALGHYTGKTKRERAWIDQVLRYTRSVSRVVIDLVGGDSPTQPARTKQWEDGVHLLPQVSRRYHERPAMFLIYEIGPCEWVYLESYGGRHVVKWILRTSPFDSTGLDPDARRALEGE